MKTIIFYKNKTRIRLKFNPGKKLGPNHFEYFKISEDGNAWLIVVPQKDNNGKLYTIPLEDIVDVVSSESTPKTKSEVNHLTGI